MIDSNHFRFKLLSKIQEDLPGEKAQSRFAPLSRPLSSIAKNNAQSYRESSVAVILFESNDEIQLLLTQRPNYDGAHSGQVAFPGGKRDAVDTSLYDTAVREAFEEVGVRLQTKDYIGSLTPVFIPVSSFHVDVHLFFLSQKPQIVADEREISEIFTVSLADLIDDSKIAAKDISVQNGIIIKNVPYFDFSEKTVWGATALVLGELREIIKSLL